MKECSNIPSFPTSMSVYRATADYKDSSCTSLFSNGRLTELFQHSQFDALYEYMPSFYSSESSYRPKHALKPVVKMYHKICQHVRPFVGHTAIKSIRTGTIHPFIT